MQFNKISLQFLTDDYTKVAYSLPIPTYRKNITKTEHQGYVTITYELKHSITSINQFKWLANIKQSMKEHIKSTFEFVEYLESKNQEYTNEKYTFKSLQEHFKSIKTIYPKIYLPTNKKDVYQRLCIYASKLYDNRIFYIELIMFAAIKMNDLLGNPYNYKELINRSKRAYDFVNKSEPQKKLIGNELKAAFKIGGIKRGEQKKMEQKKNQEQIKKLIESGEYIKPNGKVNISAIAKELSLSRVTVTNLAKKTLFSFLPLFFISYLSLMNYINCNISVYHNADSLLYTFSKSTIERDI